MTTAIITKKCLRCEVEKPLTDFYRVSYAHHRTYSYCKKCTSIISNNKSAKRYNTNDLVVDKLNSLGIASFKGHAPLFKYIDVVAWGKTRVEVKAANLNKAGYYHFALTPKQGALGLLAEIVILICNPYQDNQSFHVFNASDPVFYTNNGLKKAITYTPNANFDIAVQGGRRNPLTDMHMKNALDNWALFYSR